jgi:hypothetical protein
LLRRKIFNSRIYGLKQDHSLCGGAQPLRKSVT